jgi:hypothetical protein
VDGIDPSDDPLLELRAAVYLLSGRRRRAAPEAALLSRGPTRVTGKGTKDYPVWPNPTVLPFNDGADRRGEQVLFATRAVCSAFANGYSTFTPPGSGCSVQFGGNRTAAAPGSAQGLWLVVSHLQAALDKTAFAGIKANEVYHIGR